RDVASRWDGAVEGHCRREVHTEANCQSIRDISPIAETGDAYLAGAEGMRLEPERRRNEILGQLPAVDRSEQLAAPVVVTGKAAHRCECVRRKRHEVGESQAARYVLDVRIESSIFMNYQDARQLRWRCASRVGAHGPHQISFDDSISFFRREGFVCG